MIRFRVFVCVVIGFLIGTILFAQDQKKKTDLFQLTKTLGKHQTILERYQLRLITKNKTIYGPDLIASSRPLPLKMVLSFNEFVSDSDLEVGRVEIYGEDNVFLHAVDYPEPIKIIKRKGIQFFLTVELSTKLEHSIK